MPNGIELLNQTYELTLRDMQSTAYDRITADAERYASTEHATAVYVQEPLFSVLHTEFDDKALQERASLAADNPGEFILFPEEFSILRIRAAYHGAGLATEQRQNIPSAIRHRLSDNLDNYPPEYDFDLLTLPWTYKFKPSVLRYVLQHDYYIAACDSADGDLARLGKEQSEDE